MKTLFLSELEKEYSELIETGKIQIVEDVKKITSRQFSYSYPLYFSGNIRSRLAVVNFNETRDFLKNVNHPSDFNAYQNKHQDLGKLFLDSDCEERIESKYSTDIRILHYLDPFHVIRLNGDSLQKNLQKLTDEKFELDLIPYLSPDFSVKDFMGSYKVCKPLIERVLNGVLAYPRQYVIFIGECFSKVLAEYVVDSEHFSFVLTSPNRPNQKFLARFTRVTLKFNEKIVIAGIAESFFDQELDEIMMEKYGHESVTNLNRGLLLANPLWKSQ
jgi:hypothetical protein